jgi:hypothetical protein
LSGFEPTNIQNFPNYFESSIYWLSSYKKNPLYEIFGPQFLQKCTKQWKHFPQFPFNFSLSLFSIDFFYFLDGNREKSRAFVWEILQMFFSFLEIKLSVYWNFYSQKIVRKKTVSYITRNLKWKIRNGKLERPLFIEDVF